MGPAPSRLATTGNTEGWEPRDAGALCTPLVAHARACKGAARGAGVPTLGAWPGSGLRGAPRARRCDADPRRVAAGAGVVRPRPHVDRGRRPSAPGAIQA